MMIRGIIMSLYYVNDELYHYGVKGMKWGVRKEYDYQMGRVHNIAKYGWTQGHGKNVYSRIQNVRKDKDRMDIMSSQQKQSLANAEKYWKNRAAGKGIKASGNRGLIKRSSDAYRSKSFGRRTAQQALTSMKYGATPTSLIVGTPVTMLGEEIVYNKIFKHF